MNSNTELVTQNSNPFALKGQVASPGERTSMDAMISRQAQEVQAAMVIAKKFPRDEVRAFDKIMVACQRKSLAETAIYSFPRGGGNVSGPSIRLAEAVAQAWGNIDFGIIELEQKEGHSEVMSYAWDLESNTRETKVFTVNHFIQLKGGQVKKLTDPRDIYEMVANQGARRLRACILGVIPGDVIEAAVTKCDETLSKADSDVPLIDRLRKMVPHFGDLGVTVGMIEKRFNKKLEKINEQEFAMLRKIYASIRDGFTKAAEQFEVAAETASDLREPTTPPAEAPKQTRTRKAKEEPVAPAAATTVAANSDPGDDVPMDYPDKTAEAPKAGGSPVGGRPDFLASLKSMITASGFSEATFIETCVRRFKGPTVNTVGEFPEEYVKEVVRDFDLILNQMKTDRATQ